LGRYRDNLREEVEWKQLIEEVPPEVWLKQEISSAAAMTPDSQGLSGSRLTRVFADKISNFPLSQ
jgi:hypothetical protein